MATVPGGRVYVRVNGRLDGPHLPVVMIHGGPGSSHAAFLSLLALAEERAVILYDQLDSGLSDRPGNPANWTVARFTGEVEAVRRALGIPRWHVLGHSWGGTVALEYGARRPAQLAGLVLASPLVSTRSWIADAQALRAQLPPGVQETLNQCDPPAPITSACEQATETFYANYMAREPRPETYRTYIAAHPKLRLNEGIYEAMWGSSEFVATGTLRDYNGEPLLSKLDGPQTLFIDGQYDEARPATLGAFAAQVPGAEFAVVPGAGHAFFSDRLDEALGILRPWLRRHDSA
ncbi:MAG TPA: proline iminopeptidase-family hydrolase [Sphingomonas sp.]|nr:proline iminopeptidase-family hydrolase [Sphingomonas sp.]